MPITIQDCPKCHKPPDIGWKTLDAWGGIYDLYMICEPCQIIGLPGDTLAEAAETWNHQTATYH